MKIPLPISSNTDVANDNINAFNINAYAMKSPPQAREPYYIQSCAGLLEWAALAIGVVRAAEILEGSLYVASGTKVYKVETDKTFVEWGDIPNGGIMQSAAGFNLIIFIGEGGEIFLVDEDGVERQDGFFVDNLGDNTSTSIYPVTDVDYFNGVFVFLRKDSPTPGEYFVSLVSPVGGAKISFLITEFANAETDADPAVAVKRLTDTLAILGTKTVEFFAFGDGVPFPPILGVFYDVGCAAKATVVKNAGSMYWLGSDGTVRQDGQTISTPSVERAIADAGVLEDSFAYVFKERGLVFVAFTFGSSSTWVYNISNGGWDIRKSYPRDTWQPSIAIEFANVQLIGDGLTGKLLQVDLNTEDYDGSPRVCVSQTAYTHAEFQSVSIGAVQARLNGSAGTSTIIDPQIMMKYSLDGGRTWSKERWRSMGKAGHYRHPVRWDNNGNTQGDVLFWLSVSAAVDYQLISLDGGFTVGR